MIWTAYISQCTCLIKGVSSMFLVWSLSCMNRLKFWILVLFHIPVPSMCSFRILFLYPCTGNQTLKIEHGMNLNDFGTCFVISYTHNICSAIFWNELACDKLHGNTCFHWVWLRDTGLLISILFFISRLLSAVGPDLFYGSK
jgi:hypothetical protein